MKKFVTLFTDSFRELKAVRTITTMAMLAAVAVILGFFSIEYGQFIRIGFSSIPNGIIDYLFGPVVGGIFHGALDIIKYMMKPTGPFCPQLTLVVILAGILYGCFFYKKKLATGEGLKIQYNTKKCDISDHRNFRYCVYYMDFVLGKHSDSL